MVKKRNSRQRFHNGWSWFYMAVSFVLAVLALRAAYGGPMIQPLGFPFVIASGVMLAWSFIHDDLEANCHPGNDCGRHTKK